jgi:hypothetical protein
MARDDSQGSSLRAAESDSLALTIAAHLPGSPERSRLPAIVRWSREGAFGVQFVSLGARDTRLIAELLAKAGRTA